MVTGVSSMIGKEIAKSLKTVDEDCEVFGVYHEECDLLDFHQVHSMFTAVRPEYVIHAAGYNGGIFWNKNYPATIFYRTVQMGLNVLEMSQRFNVSKVLSIISSCSYPDLLEEMKEGSLWDGPANPTVECHAYAKRFLDAFSRQISQQYSTECVSVVLNNSYGPYDNFHPEKTKVVGALIKKFVDAREQNLEEVVCWGTGAPLRELTYSVDAGYMIAQSLFLHSNPYVPLNIGSDEEISIKDLAELIATTVGYNGQIKWDTTKPDGQYRKKLDLTTVKELLGDKFIVTPIKRAIKETVDWYEKYKKYSSLQKT